MTALREIRLTPRRPRLRAALPPRPTRSSKPWINVAFAVLCLASIAASILLLGPTATATQTQSRIVTAERGVVQSTVSGSGSLAPANQASVNFKTSGVLSAVYVSAGQHVNAGQLLAQINPTNAQANLTQAQANLTAAQAKLAATVADPSGSATGSSSGTSGTPTTGASSKTGSSTTTTSTAASAATQAANLASAQAAVQTAQAGVTTAQQALDETKLYAPIAGTVAAVSAGVGDSVSGNGSSSGGSASSGSGGSGGSGGGAGGSSASAGASTASGTGSSSSSSSGSAFITLVALSRMQLVVPMAESSISKVKVGQPATVTVQALPTEKLAAHVTSIGLLPTSNSGVVSYQVTLRLDQQQSGLRDGMSATAQIVVSQAQGAITVPSAAVTTRGGTSTVTVVRNGKQVPRTVVTGVVGDSTTQVLSGLTAGEQVAIPIVTVSSSGGSAGGTGTGARTGGTGAGGGPGAGGGFGGGGFGGGGARLGGGLGG